MWSPHDTNLFQLQHLSSRSPFCVIPLRESTTTMPRSGAGKDSACPANRLTCGTFLRIELVDEKYRCHCFVQRPVSGQLQPGDRRCTRYAICMRRSELGTRLAACVYRAISRSRQQQQVITLPSNAVLNRLYQSFLHIYVKLHLFQQVAS